MFIICLLLYFCTENVAISFALEDNLPLALGCYQVCFWRNCIRLLPKNGKISQEHHWQLRCQEQFELSYATGRQSFPIDSSPLPRSKKQKKKDLIDNISQYEISTFTLGCPFHLNLKLDSFKPGFNSNLELFKVWVN